jgi:hypothetical protein
MPRTTLNIHTDVMTQISHAATKINKSQRDIIVMLLIRIVQNHSGLQRGFTTVKYQPDAGKEAWHKFHICYRSDENEYFGDLRRFCKYSVSYLVAIAVEKYLDQLIGDKTEKGRDNYACFRNYVLYQEVVDGILSWRIYWGFPLEELKTLHLRQDDHQS